jgi:hypothetical protein
MSIVRSFTEKCIKKFTEVFHGVSDGLLEIEQQFFFFFRGNNRQHCSYMYTVVFGVLFLRKSAKILE